MKLRFTVVTSALMVFIMLLCSCSGEKQGSVAAGAESGKKYIALTFDDGPYTPVTNKILDVLADNNAKATFFIVGNRAELYPESVKRAYQMGCEIGNHTYSHADLCSKSHATIQKELRMCSHVIYNITGAGEKLFRPTGGKNDSTLRCDAHMPLILWSVDTMDWSHQNSKKTVKHVLDNVCDGSIILMHDLIPSTADACRELVPELKKRGYELVTVSELMEINGITMTPGEKYFKAAATA